MSRISILPYFRRFLGSLWAVLKVWLCLVPIVYFWAVVAAFIFTDEADLINRFLVSSPSQIHQGFQRDLIIVFLGSTLIAGMYSGLRKTKFDTANNN